MASNVVHPSERRAELRVPVQIRGTLSVGDISAPCLVQNMCARGFLIKAGRGLPSGHAMRLRCELYSGQPVECTVQVRHVNADCLGARIIEIGDDAKRICQRYLAEQRGSGPGIAARQ